MTGVTQRLNTKYQLKRVQDFIDRTPELGVAKEAFAQALENINTNIRWRETNLEPVTQWLNTAINTGEPTVNYRLPKHLMPIHYDFTMQPYFNVTQKPEYYDATIRIHFKCVNSTNKFVIHKKDIDINSTTLRITSLKDSVNFPTMTNFAYTYDNETSFLTVDLDEEHQFVAGEEYTFETEFRAYTKNDNVGFYRTSYTDDSKLTK